MAEGIRTDDDRFRAILALAGALLARGDPIDDLRAALADLRRSVVDYLEATAQERTGDPTPEEAELYSALRRSAAVLRGERDVDFPPVPRQ